MLKAHPKISINNLMFNDIIKKNNAPENDNFNTTSK